MCECRYIYRLHGSAMMLAVSAVGDSNAVASDITAPTTTTSRVAETATAVENRRGRQR